MQLRYDEDFLEAAVNLFAHGRSESVHALQVTRYHRERERLYAVLDPDDRNTAFFKLHLDWFREWRLDQPLNDLLRQFPLLGQKLEIFGIRKASTRKDEGAELYVNDGGQRTALLAFRVERLLDKGSLQSFLHHEFMHLHDMVDPAFNYSPVLELPGLNAAQRRIACERYRLLWDITIDARISAAGKPTLTSAAEHMTAFERGYGFWPADRRAQAFEKLWAGRSPNHHELLELIKDPRGLRGSHGPVPGGACPLCEFPTFTWAQGEEIRCAVKARIAAEFPNWQPADGLCGRCLETYEEACATAA